MITDPILEKANNILAEIELKKQQELARTKRDETIIKAGLCPKCGEDLNKITEDKKKFIKSNNLHHCWDVVTSIKACSKDINHFSKIEGYDWDDDYDD